MAGNIERRVLLLLYTTEDERVEGGLTPELLHLKKYLQRPTLEEGLIAAGVQRAVDVGTASNFETAKHLAKSQFQGQSVFTPENVWAIDPRLASDRFLQDRLPKYGHLFRRLPLSAQDLQTRIVSAEIAPFDLVLSKGVISTGWNLGSEEIGSEYSIGAEYSNRLEVARALKGCLNPQNPNSLLVLSSIDQDEMLPINDRDLDQLGLELVYNSKAPKEDSVWAGNFQRSGLFPPPPYNNFYNLIICRNK